MDKRHCLWAAITVRNPIARKEPEALAQADEVTRLHDAIVKTIGLEPMTFSAWVG